MKKLLLLSAFIFFVSGVVNAQFIPAEFKANCDCEFVKEYEKPAPGGYMVTSYKCVSKSLGDVALYRVTLMDLSKDFRRIKANQVRQYLDGYYTSLVTELENAKIDTEERKLNGARTIEYQQMVKFDDKTVPQKTTVFVQNKKSITLQMASNSPLIDRKFDDFKNSFVLLNSL